MPDPASHNFARVENDHFVERVELIQPNGTPVDLTGITAAALRIAVDHATAAAWTASIGDGITVAAPASGVLEISKSLAGLAAGSYVYDLDRTIVGLTYTPASYSGAGGQLVRVNAGAAALEFVAGSSLFAAASHTHDAGTDLVSGVVAVARGGTGSGTLPALTDYTPTAATVAGHLQGISERLDALPAAQLTGTLADARVAESNVTQHEAALAIAWGQLTSVPGTFAPSAHTHAATDINSGTLDAARLPAVATRWDVRYAADGAGSALSTGGARRMKQKASAVISGVTISLDAADTGTLTVRIKSGGVTQHTATATITADDEADVSSLSWDTGDGSVAAGEEIEVERTSGFGVAEWMTATLYGSEV